MKFLELELRIPDPADDELPAGLVFLNTNPLLAPQDGPGGQVGELISGNSEEDFDGDGEAKPGDVFMFQKQQIPPRADGTVCDEKLKERQFSFDGASAHRRRVEFILSGDGCGPTGFNVKETSGILDCNFSQFDVDSTPGLGGLNAELCGGRE